MNLFWKTFLIFLISYPFIVASISIDSLFIDLIHRNISDVKSFDKFYKDILKDIRHHRPIDTVLSPINIEKIRSKNYTEDYLKNACYETGADLLYAHGYDKTDLKLSINDLQSLLPAVLYSIENPGCKRQLPPVKQQSFIHVWILGLISIVIMKLIHLIVFFLGGHHFSALTSSGISKTLANQNSSDEIRFSTVKYHLWLGLTYNALTCGLILGTVIYHLIPHIYEVPNEDFNYTYLLRGTIVLCGMLLFFIVEKLLRFRFKVDEVHSDEPHTDETAIPSDTSMIQMHEKLHVHHKHSDAPVRMSANVDSADEETDLQTDKQHISHHKNREHQTRNRFLYHLIYDFSNDIIYGCGLSTAIEHNRLLGLILWMVIFSEGFRRHSQLLSSLGRKHGLAVIFFSIIFLLLGYVIGGMFIQLHQQLNLNIIYIHKEYIYSIVYGILFYTALVTLISELNDFGQHLQVSIKPVNQTIKQRRSLKFLIFLCQNLFLIIGVLIALLLAIIWRYYHRRYIYQYVCNRDSSRIFCH